MQEKAFENFKSFFFKFDNMNSQILEQIRLLKPELKEQFHVQEIAVFGSVVRNEANESSDLDILVKFEKPLGFKFIS